MYQQQAALPLLECIKAFAAQETNPVLQVIDVSKPLVEFAKYPGEKLLFGNTGWGAYYHCHGDPFRFEHEHGHFHIFHQDKKQKQQNKWTHIAALSMDAYGQPRQWFTVNAWVTDEDFKPTNEVIRRISTIDNLARANLALVEQWLLLMIQFFQAELTGLIEQRDARLYDQEKNHIPNSVLEDRHIYLLTSKEINLQASFNSLEDIN